MHQGDRPTFVLEVLKRGGRGQLREALRYGAVVGLAALVLAGLLSACGGDEGQNDEQPAGAECPPGAIAISAPSGAAAAGFDKTELVVPAGERFTVCFDNMDTGIQHNFAASNKGAT